MPPTTKVVSGGLELIRKNKWSLWEAFNIAAQNFRVNFHSYIINWLVFLSTIKCKLEIKSKFSTVHILQHNMLHMVYILPKLKWLCKANGKFYRWYVSELWPPAISHSFSTTFVLRSKKGTPEWFSWLKNYKGLQNHWSKASGKPTRLSVEPPPGCFHCNAPCSSLPWLQFPVEPVWQGFTLG